MNKIKVKVPATSANLGSGFDCVGIAYDLYNVFEFEIIENGLIINGCESEFANESNLLYVAYKAVCDKIGKESNVKITVVEANIPFSRGLGSSATLICAGAYSANKLHGERLSTDEIFAICTELEGHPDNVAPALFGSLCVCVMENNTPRAVRFDVSSKLHFTALIPDFSVETHDAREVLPELISREDAVYDMSRVALLPYALERADLELLKLATKDRLHEKYRKKLFRNIDEIKKIAMECGACSFNISGAGSTCLAISSKPIEKKLNEKIKNMSNGWVAKELRISINGTREVKD